MQANMYQIKSTMQSINLHCYQFTQSSYILQPQVMLNHDGLSYVAGRLVQAGHSRIPLDKLPAHTKLLVPFMPTSYVDRLSAAHTNLCYTTFETSQLPQSWINALNTHYHACIVPHPAIKQVFTESGIDIPIFVAQQGYTRLPQKPVKTNTRQETTSGKLTGGKLMDSKFIVGFLGVPQIRKNLSALIKACQSLIRNKQVSGLQLQIHIPTRYAETDQMWLEEIAQQKFIQLTQGIKTEQELVDWYAGLSAYCFPSSGEGWSFTPRESLYLGIPTILSDIPVHQELIASGYCQAISTSGDQPGVYKAYQQNQLVNVACGYWSRISSETIAEAIHQVCRNYPYWQEQARLGQDWIKDQWTNEASLATVKHIIEQL